MPPRTRPKRTRDEKISSAKTYFRLLERAKVLEDEALKLRKEAKAMKKGDALLARLDNVLDRFDEESDGPPKTKVRKVDPKPTAEMEVSMSEPSQPASTPASLPTQSPESRLHWHKDERGDNIACTLDHSAPSSQ